MAHGFRGFSVMGGKTGGEDWLTLCQGGGLAEYLGSGQDVAPKGMSLLPGNI